MKIALLGDIALINHFDLTKNSRIEIENQLLFLKNELSQYEYRIANLESPLTNKHNTLICKSMHLKSNSENVEILKYLEIDAVSLANNHVMDFGKKGLDDTIDILEKNNIEWFGAYNKNLLKQEGDVLLSMSGFCCYSANGVGTGKYINELSLHNVQEQMLKDKKINAVSLLSFHWGQEHTNYPSYDQIKIIKTIQSFNECIIQGHHSHTMQGYDIISDKKLCFYSLGNTIFDDCTSINGKKTVYLNEDNKKSYFAIIDIGAKKIKIENLIGFQNRNNSLLPLDIHDEVCKLSEQIKDVKSRSEYRSIESIRNIQISNTLSSKFGKKNLHWLLQRANYYSIGSLILGKIRSTKYKKVMANFNE